MVMPLFIASYIAASRVVDHRHSPADVTAGALVGIFSACMFFLRFACSCDAQVSLAEELANGGQTEALARVELQQISSRV